MNNKEDVVIKYFLHFLGRNDYDYDLLQGNIEIGVSNITTNFYKLFDTDQRLRLKKKSGSYVTYIVLDDDRLLCIDESERLEPYKKTYKFYLYRNACLINIETNYAYGNVNLVVKQSNGRLSIDNLDDTYAPNLVPNNFHMSNLIRHVNIEQLIRRGKFELLDETLKRRVMAKVDIIEKYARLYANTGGSSTVDDLFSDHADDLTENYSNIEGCNLNEILVDLLEEKMSQMVAINGGPITEDNKELKLMYDFLQRAQNLIKSLSGLIEERRGENAK